MNFKGHGLAGTAELSVGQQQYLMIQQGLTHNMGVETIAAFTAPISAFGPAATRFLAQYRDCVATGMWARLFMRFVEAESASELL
jgi:hypothetical protein